MTLPDLSNGQLHVLMCDDICVNIGPLKSAVTDCCPTPIAFAAFDVIFLSRLPKACMLLATQIAAGLMATESQVEMP